LAETAEGGNGGFHFRRKSFELLNYLKLPQFLAFIEGVCHDELLFLDTIFMFMLTRDEFVALFLLL